ncbi:MAG: DUF6694 family lipoprotein [Thermodesulfobacteriota bacterium]
MRYKLIALVLITLIMAGCSRPTVDASTEETLKSSVAKVKASLTPDKQAEFEEAIQILAISQIDFGSVFSGKIEIIDDLQLKIKETINGKTAEQIITEANQVKLQREREQKTQALQEIKELEEKRLTSEQAREQLKKFKVIRSRLYRYKTEFSISKNVIDLTVKNETDHAISRAYFHGVLASPGRSVPWHQDDFNYQISGGIEPGEEVSWSLTPNMMSKFSNIDIPEDAIFTVTVEGIDGPEGKTLFSTKSFGESEEKRLAELKAKFQ